ncbi:MAG: hypothetical protein AAGI01_11305 [Myxococcota bacterium]
MIELSVMQTLLVEEFEATVDGQTYHVDEDKRLTVVLVHTNGVMMIPKVRALDFRDDVVIVTTDEERTYLPPATIFALRGANPEKATDENRPGFRR